MYTSKCVFSVLTRGEQYARLGRQVTDNRQKWNNYLYITYVYFLLSVRR